MILDDNPKGLHQTANDELEIISKTQPNGDTDSAAVRFESENKIIGKISWNQPRRRERMILTGDLEDGFKFQMNPSGGTQDRDMVTLMTVNWSGIEYRVPVIGAGNGNGFPSRVALRTHHGKYLCIEPGGRIVADRDAPGPWESLDVVPV